MSVASYIGIQSPIMENQMDEEIEKKMKIQMEAGVLRGSCKESVPGQTGKDYYYFYFFLQHTQTNRQQKLLERRFVWVRHTNGTRTYSTEFAAGRHCRGFGFRFSLGGGCRFPFLAAPCTSHHL